MSLRTISGGTALVAVVLIVVSCGGGTSSPSASPSATVTATPSGLQDIGAELKGRSGLAATVYTQGLTHAAAFAFDEQGRLWVAAAAYSDDGTDAVYLVAAAGAAPVKVIADVHTPLGLLWYQGSLYVTSKERVDAYSGFDGTQFAQHRAILALPSGVGEVNGIALSPEGRMLMGITAPCDHCTPALQDSGAIVSFLPDGTDLQVYAAAIRAPIGLAYFPNTSDLFVTMNQRDDLGDATPGDWLAVVQHGQDWGFPNCYGQGGDACAGVPTPVAALDKHGAVDGVAIVTGQLGAAVGTAAIVAEWSTGKVQQVTLARSGATYTGTVAPFLTGLRQPVPVILTPDGALLVGDWASGKVYRVTIAS